MVKMFLSICSPCDECVRIHLIFSGEDFFVDTWTPTHCQPTRTATGMVCSISANTRFCINAGLMLDQPGPTSSQHWVNISCEILKLDPSASGRWFTETSPPPPPDPPPQCLSSDSRWESLVMSKVPEVGWLPGIEPTTFSRKFEVAIRWS